ncbi:tripartite tricarboxylate transporter TctB family protein [Bradyrhizobium pachyrhizi]|uniref:tripartite tricarboxylate transporter TctB family protein n=1 Tax=Bradyrhizobium pachyrhizi TaxID=280333 RepID=UPI003D3663A9
MDQMTVVGTEVPIEVNASAPVTGARLASVILTAAGLFYLYHASQLPLGDPPGTGVGAIPLLMGICWLAFGAYSALRIPKASPESGLWPRGHEALRVLATLLLCVTFIAALPFFGIFLTTAIFLLLMARLAGSPWKSALILSVATPAAFWVVFSWGLKVSLPYGSLVSDVLRG